MSNSDVVISRADIMAAADSIEALPATVSKLLELIGDDDYSIQQLVEVVRFDTALAGDVLVRANSAASGAVRQIADLQEAASRVGAATVVDIALRRAMRDRFAKAVPAYGLAPAELWRHSLIASVAAEQVRKAASAPIPQSIATAALVHDVGKMVIAKCLPEGMTDVLLVAAEADAIPLHEAERNVLGLDHGEVSSVVVRTWGLPLSIQVALTQHHLESTGDPFYDALVLADRIAHVVVDLDTASASPDDDPDVDPDTAAAEAFDQHVAELLRDRGANLASCGIAPGAVAGLVAAAVTASADAMAALNV